MEMGDARIFSESHALRKSMFSKAVSLAVAFALLAIVQPSFSARGLDIYVASNIVTDTTWGSGDTIYINGLIHVTPGTTLTIMPGATIKFDADSVLYFDGGAAVYAVGNASSPIIFTSNSSSPTAGAWNKLQFEEGCEATIAYAEIYYASIGMNVLGGNVSLDYAKVGFATTGVQQSGGNMSINMCVINATTGVKIAGALSPTIANSTLNCAGESFSISLGATPTAINCSFDQMKVTSTLGSNLTVKRYLEPTVRWTNATGTSIYPAEGAHVYVNASDGTNAFNGVADQLGSVGTLELVSSVITIGPSFTNLTPYSVNASLSGISGSALADLSSSVCTISLIDEQSPSLWGINWPLDYANTSAFNITGSASDDESGLMLVEYSIDGSTFTDADGLSSWYANFTIPLDGAYVLAVRAYDRVGNCAEASSNFVLDTTAPEFVYVLPGVGYSTNKGYIWLNASFSEPVNATVNDVVVSTMADSFNKTYNLTLGWNYFTINITDRAGNGATTFRNICYDITAPEIFIALPQNNTLTNNASLDILVMTEPWAQFSIGGACAGGANETGIFSCHRTLNEGNNIIWIAVSDFAGNVNQTFINVTLDTIAPWITIISPLNGSIINSTNATFEGIAEPGVFISLDGVPIDISSDGSFDCDVAGLVEGENTFTFVVTDEAGNRNDTSITIILDTLPPALSASYILQSPTLSLITGSAENGSRIFANGSEIFLVGTSFSYSWSLIEGNNTMVLEALDAAGNRNFTTISIVCDITPPALSVTSANGTVTNQKVIELEGATEAGATLTIGNSIVELSANGSFKVNYSLVEGMNAIRFSSCDAAGNYANYSLYIMLDTPPYVAAQVQEIFVNDTENKSFCASDYIIDNLTGDMRWEVSGVNTELYNVSISFCQIKICPVRGANGNDTFQLTGYDARNQSATITITVNVKKVLPKPGTVSGRLVDAKGTPVGDAQVNLEGIALFNLTRTDSEGRFKFENVPVGNYLVRINKAGFKEKLVSCNVIAGVETPLDDISLVKEVKPTPSDNLAYAIIFVALFAIVIVMLAAMLMHHKQKLEEAALENELSKPSKESLLNKEPEKEDDEIDEGPRDDEEDSEELPITKEDEADVDDSVVCMLCNTVITNSAQTYSCDCGKVMHDECASKAGKCPSCKAKYDDK